MYEDLFSMTGRLAVVTGASRGIGRAVARALAEAGADVVMVARSETQLESAAQEITTATGRRIRHYRLDLMDRAAVDRFARTVVAEFGVVDVLVNNAGINHPQTLLETSDENWDHMIEMNLTSQMRLTRALVPGMVEQGWGRVIYTSSIMALASKHARGIYSATKAALVGMMRAQTLELGPAGITVNCLAPGPVLTDMTMGLLNDEQKQQFSDATALKRWGQVEDMVGPLLMLASDAGAFISGEVIVADGGLLCRTFAD